MRTHYVFLVAILAATGCTRLYGDRRNDGADGGGPGGPMCSGDGCSCSGVACTQPSAAACLDASTLRTYSAAGTCSAGQCSYRSIDTHCTQGCAAAACIGEPCAGIQCDQPPASSCVDANTLRTYPATGTCSNGSCAYSPVDTACPSGCSDGRCKGAAAKGAIIAAGNSSTCAIGKGGEVQCWGWNLYGQLGNGSTTDSHVPVSVKGVSSGVTAIVAGALHACALAGGATQCWGYNARGELGDNTATNRLVPVSVLASGVTALSAGSNFTCALGKGGGIECWGYNGVGQLGNGSTNDGYQPYPVQGLESEVAQVAAGAEYACAVLASGAVPCWGDSDETHFSTVPVDVPGLMPSVSQVVVGQYYACALMNGGGVYCWGHNESGQLGNGSKVESTAPVAVQGLTGRAIALNAGDKHTCALLENGGVQCWGWNFYGQLGNNSTTDSSVAVNVQGLASGVVALDAGPGHTCAVLSNGGIRCWGSNYYGQLGNNSTTDSPVPVSVVGYP